MLLATSSTSIPHLRQPSTTITPPYNHDSTSTTSYSESTTLPSSTQQWFQYFVPTTSNPAPYNLLQLEIPSPAYFLQPQPGADDTSLFAYGVGPDLGNNTHQNDSSNNYQGLQRRLELGLMQSDHSVVPSSWHFSNGQLTPTSARNHQRESSLSSLGSAGPASPYNLNTSHPQVVLPSDSAGEVYYDGLPGADQATYHNFSKTPSQTLQESYLPTAFQHNYNLHSYNSQPNYNSLITMHKQNANGEAETMSAPDYGHSSRPSVANTHDSPATPSVADDLEEQNRKIGEPFSALQEHWTSNYSPFDHDTGYRTTGTIPKLDRTMSDAYNDELYSPSFSFTSAPPSQSEKLMLSPSQHSDSFSVFSQRLQAATSQHLNASSQPIPGDQSRGRSPFRQGSPLAPSVHQTFNSQQVRLGSAAQMRVQQKAENDARVLEEQIRRSTPEQSAPKTISPKDALLDYHETGEEAAMPLFPPQPAPPQPAPQYQFAKPSVQEPPSDFDDSSSQQSFASMVTSRRPSSSAYSTSSQATQRNGSGFAFAPPSVPGGVQVPQQYPFVPQQRQQASSMSTATRTSMESSSSEYVPNASGLNKPAKSSADGGTYTCTYHGCTLRFETPAKLQKHKREGHRQSVPPTGGAGASAAYVSDGGSGMTSAALLRNSQAGPHKCERINPSTGKPCNTIFSRPYDLTRHEDTIHNARKQKVRCHLCTEEKTFSRNDALTRHMRVVHPEVDFPGKHRRRL